MTQAPHQRHTRILATDPVLSIDREIDRVQRDHLAHKCRDIFNRLYPQLIDNYFNWHIAIDPSTEKYLLDPTLIGVTQQIKDVYGDRSELKLTIFRLNETGTCGRL